MSVWDIYKIIIIKKKADLAYVTFRRLFLEHNLGTTVALKGVKIVQEEWIHEEKQNQKQWGY